MKTYSTRGIATAQAIANRETFKTHGSLRAVALPAPGAGIGAWDSGRLSGDDLDRFHGDCPRMTYVVFSYVTPIAWVTDEGLVHKVKQRFSVTTSKHQGMLYLL